MDPNILLINPAVNPKTQKRFISSIIRATFPFSLGHLAGYLLRDERSRVQIHDEQIHPLLDGQLGQVLALMSEPKIIGLTTLTATSARVYELAEEIKALEPQTVVVIGGVHATVLPEEGLEKGAIDIVVRGEGEETLQEIVNCVHEGRDYRGLSGISYRRDDEIIHNPNRPLIKDLDSLPPFPYDLFHDDMARYPGFESLQTSRGCPYACTFCSQRSITGRTYRYVSTERALRDIELLVDKYDAKLIRIMDDNLAVHKRRLHELLNGIIERGLHEKASFEAPMRGDNIDEGILKGLKRANFSLVTYGLETASESLMKAISKGETVEQVADAIRMTAAKGMSVGTTVIFGLPGETSRDRWDAIKLVSSLPLDSVRFNTLTPYPGTPVYQQLSQEGKVVIKDGWENFSVQYMWEGDDLPYVPDDTDPYELMFMTMLANLMFYLRPSGLRKLFTGSAAGGNVISLKKNWYFSSFAFKIARVGFYLTSRFAVVFGRMMVRKLSRLGRT